MMERASAQPAGPSGAGADSVATLRATVAALRDELLACQRLALLGNLTAMITHEFNNLLTPLMARAEAALATNDVAFMRKALDRVLVQSQRAMHVMRHLLALAHGNGDAPVLCAVADAVREALETLTRPLEKDGIDAQVDVPTDLRVPARPELLCQLLLNLLLNARAAMQGGHGTLRITARRSGALVRIDVSDTGRGLSPEQIRDVFNPFLAADPAAEPGDWRRVGLGLSVCRLIARHHGARLSVAANPGPGCTFTIEWPAG